MPAGSGLSPSRAARGPDVAARDKVFSLVRKLIRRIEAKHGSYTCRNLTGLEGTGPESLKVYYERGTPEKVCHHVTRDAVEIAEEIW